MATSSSRKKTGRSSTMWGSTISTSTRTCQTPSIRSVARKAFSSNSAACQFSSVGTNTSSNVMLPRDELPSRHFGFEVPSAASQEAPPPEKSSQDMEARTKQREKRQQAKQRYNDKKKNRRFGKQIMYVSRKARADTRNRVKGRFAKASSSAHGDNPDMQP
ncbi:zinc finger protein CONSTANS-LIKE 3-like isoform X2 [Phragmites australis]|uniref:zinc finger protein CONSTANS-LIKE 3-like isoform X2 n=1 Tax=Phragmites australis TaxID=29695 RepID=UPI002D7A3A28|nr:zinc finger protein CONSTANS-LIKE 3-like isoform X2 [Phragmites australis]